MSQNLKSEIPMSKRFFPGLLRIVGDEKYKQVIARYQELFEKHELPQPPPPKRHINEGNIEGHAF